MSYITTFTAEYVWIGGENELRSKTRILKNSGTNKKLPEWDYDGTSTKQADGDDSEVILKPCAVFYDPFRKANDKNLLVLCSTYKPNMQPVFNNNRHNAEHIFRKSVNEETWFGLEQEYFIYDNKTSLPLGFSVDGKQGQYYCSVGSRNAYGREIVEEHLEACLYAGVNITGINAEVAPGQWEFQIGICKGIDAADHLWMARYILERISEKYNVYINYHPKPLKGDWNGSGCHTNFSTKKMRDPDNGLNEIYKAISLLENKHSEHMQVYGAHNRERLSGIHETSGYNKFTSGIANRGASVRIGNKTVKDGCGYFEDRRPSSNMDPYLVTAKIVETICL